MPPRPARTGRAADRRPVRRRAQRGPRARRAAVDEPVAAADPGLLALPVRPGQPAPRVRSRRGARVPPRPAAGAWTGWEPGETKTVRLVRYRAARRGRRSDDPPVRRGVPGALRPDDRRPGPARRHGPLDPGRARTAQARGDEPVWGYAKNLRARIAQWDDASGPSELDVVLAGALVVDPVIGVVKADIGIKDGRIAGVGRAGSPAITRRDRPRHRPAHEVVHGLRADRDARAPSTPTSTRSAPELLPPALSAGVTTLITAGFEEPPFAMERTLGRARGLAAQRRDAGGRAGDGGRAPRRAGRRRRRRGSRSTRTTAPTRSSSTTSLRYADARGRRRSASTPTGSTSRPSSRTRSRRSPAGRSTPTTSRAPAAATSPTCSASCASRSILCSSTTPTLPFGVHAAVEHVPMTVLNHGRSWAVPGDVELVRERSTRRRMAAEGPLHELGRDRDRELRLAGDGPDRRDGPPDVPAGPRHEGVAPVRGRRRASRACPPTRVSTTRTTATTRSACCATSRR